MTRRLKRLAAAALLASAAFLALPALAAAADAAPWVGTYKGVAVGKDAKGKKGSSGVTIWVEDAGDSTRFTFRVDKFPAVFSRTVPNAGGVNGSMLMRISVDEPGVSGAGMIVVYPRNGNYMMAGKGAGKAAGKQGTGRLGAVRTSTGVQLPSMADQIKDLFTALISRKIKSSSSPSGGGSSGLPPAVPLAILSDDVAAASDDTVSAETTTEYDPDAVVKQAPDVVFVKAVVVEPASVIDVAAAKPPATTQTAFTVAIALIVLTAITAIVSIGPKLRGTVTATAPVEQPGSDREGS